tara:strand:- start:9172 stop:9696 length:525 start_codon:yes stop_codon:yes gene_type:complete
MKTKQVKTNRLILRNPLPKDSKEYSKIGVSYHSTGKIDTEKKSREHITKSLNSKNSFEWGLFLKTNGELIGIVELGHLDWFNDKAGGEMSHNIKKEYQKMGFGLESAKALINYCFKSMKLHKIYADTTPGNIGAQKLLKRLGFKLEGRIRDRRKIKGKWVDELDYGLLNKEWKN